MKVLLIVRTVGSIFLFVRFGKSPGAANAFDHPLMRHVHRPAFRTDTFPDHEPRGRCPARDLPESGIAMPADNAESRQIKFFHRRSLR